ncbi:unnamed protein product [Knipowitschia caucasica]|uniref:Uncharacterized protein n=1 Tax=Knipowitschia caucasica TaxID=637954 RepID=A0AAV2LV75_KNICA
MIEFVTKLIREKLGVTTELRIERAHRTPAAFQGQYPRPRSIVVRFQSYTTKQQVLKAAWTKKIVQMDETRIYFDEDFSPVVFKERGKYRDVRKMLRERNIRHHILFPAKLKIFCENGKAKVFDNPAAAAEGLREYGIEMTLPAEDPDLDSLLRATGWQTPGSHKRRTPETETMNAMKVLLGNKK